MNHKDEMILIDMQNQIDTLRSQMINQMRITLDLIKILKDKEDSQ